MHPCDLTQTLDRVLRVLDVEIRLRREGETFHVDILPSRAGARVAAHGEGISVMEALAAALHDLRDPHPEVPPWT